MFSSAAMTAQRPQERDAETGVLIETTEEILARKLHGRIMGLGDFVARDFYDLCVASREDPEAYTAARAMLSDDDVADILAELDGVRPGGKPVLAPKYVRLAEDLWRHSRILLESGRLPQSLFEARDLSVRDSAE